MLDMMSYNPGPTRESACKEIYGVFSNNKNISNIYLKKIIHKIIYSYEEGGLGSEAGWLVGYKGDVIEKVQIQLDDWSKIRMNYINIRSYIRTIIRCIGAFSLSYRTVIEKRYAPGGVFETTASLYWNPILSELKPDTGLNPDDIDISYETDL